MPRMLSRRSAYHRFRARRSMARVAPAGEYVRSSVARVHQVARGGPHREAEYVLMLDKALANRPFDCGLPL